MYNNFELGTRLKVNDLVVNWHLTEACNYRCNYCYAAWSQPPEAHALWRDAKRSYQLLSEIGKFFSVENNANPLFRMMEWNDVRLSLAGGEPLILGKRFRQVVHQAESLGFKVSMITNGSLLDSDTLTWLCPKLDMLGISIDAEESKLNHLIGRQNSRGETISSERLVSIIDKARSINPKLKIKLNTVVNQQNWDADLTAIISRCQPDRWKILRVLPSISEAHAISSEMFAYFLDTHKDYHSFMSIEDNSEMDKSYIMIDPHGRFFQNNLASRYQNEYVYSDEILKVGVNDAFNQIEFDSSRFVSRYTRLDGVIAA